MCGGWVGTHVRAHAHQGEKRTTDPLELELKAVVSHLTWVLGTELRSPGRIIHALNCKAITLAYFALKKF